MKEFLENRRIRKITKKVFLEQQLLNINQEELKFKKDQAVGMDKQDEKFSISMGLLNIDRIITFSIDKVSIMLSRSFDSYMNVCYQLHLNRAWFLHWCSLFT